MSVKHVFVYGTLMRDMDNHHLIKPFAKTVLPASITGGEIYHLTYGYPAMLLSGANRGVKGEIIEINDMSAALPVLDHLEGYHGDRNPKNLYDRVICRAETTDGQKIDVYVYVWSHPEQLPAIGQLLEGGCWRSFMAARPDDIPDKYYFAYGSCMDYEGRIAASDFAGDFHKVGIARLDGWEFRMNKKTADGRHAYANIQPAPDAAVYGVLYKITARAEREYLNRRDGYPYHYYKEYLDVKDGDKVYPSAIVYVAQPDYQAEGLAVTISYENELKRGGQSLPEPYRAQFLKEIEECARRRG